MGRLFYISIFLFFQLLSFGNDIKINNMENKFDVIEKTTNEFRFTNNISEINTELLSYEEGDFIKLLVDGYSTNSEYGRPELPELKKLFRIPYGSDIEIIILDKEEQVISLNEFGIVLPIIPNQPSISKGDDSRKVSFFYDKKSYKFNKFNNNKIINVKVLGKIRGQTMGRLDISPFSYNPITNKLKIINKLEVKIVFRNTDSKSDMLNRRLYFDHNYEHLYKQFINYLPIPEKDIITNYPVKYVIISDSIFQPALQPFIEWKIKKGFIVLEEYTSNPLVGNSSTSIKAFLKDLYDNATINDPAPTYLLIVGDISQVPSFQGNTGNHPSDMYYCEFDGNGDFYPEMYYGRLSANIPEELIPQIQKTLEYEQYTMPDPSYLDEVVMVSGVDASMAPTYGNGQINYGNDNYFNNLNGINSNTYLYASGSGITSNMSTASAAIISDISNGVGFANYTAHCGTSGWSDPSFSNLDIPTLQNTNKYGLIIGNCCQSNKFDVQECFGEALLRADGRGAVGYIGGTNNTYWDEDYWWSVGNGTTPPPTNPTYIQTGLGAYDCIFHENGEQESDWFITQGQMLHSGNLAVTQSGGSEEYYWEIYHLMGDPSVMPYMGVPSLMNISHLASIPLGTSILNVNAEENAYVSISMNGILLDAQIVDSTGNVTMSFPPFTQLGTADIVVTKQFRQPYISTISILSANSPFVICSNYLIDDSLGNNNGKVDYGETIRLDVSLLNLGTVNTSNINLKLSSNDQYITIIDSISSYTNINGSQSINIIDAFSINIDNLVPDQHHAQFNLYISDTNGNIWSNYIQLVLNAPYIGHLSFIINDSITGNNNGKLDIGETAEIIIRTVNSGNSDVSNLLASLSCLSNYVSISSSTYNINSLSINQSKDAFFTISIDPQTPLATIADFPFNITNGIYTYNYTFSDMIGVVDDDFEIGNFTSFPWLNGNYPWIIDSLLPYEGIYCSKSNESLPDNAKSELSVTFDVLVPGNISFYYSVSSEKDYDFLRFSINGARMSEWSGNKPWTLATYPVGIGINTFKWEYEKDGNWSSGQDCSWIDYIVFPPINLNPSLISEVYDSIKLYPNPTMGMFSINFSNNTFHRVVIFNMDGKIINSFNNIRENTWDFSLDGFRSGTYIIKILPEDVTYQIVKQ